MNTISPIKNKSKRKRTQKQIEASRKNGKKSQGPVTEAGKQTSSRNSYRFGLFSKKLFILDIENSEDFDRMLQMFQAEWQPTGPSEATLVRSLALETISLDRFRMLQTEALNSITGRIPDSHFVCVPAGEERLYGGLEEYTRRGLLPNLVTIDRLIARADRTFRASLNSILQLRRARKDMKIDPFEPPPSRFDGLRPTPPGEPSESLELRLAEFKRQHAETLIKENEQTNPGASQTPPVEPLPDAQVPPAPTPRATPGGLPPLSGPTPHVSFSVRPPANRDPKRINSR